MTELDCRGLSCPEPVLRTRDWVARDAPEEVRVRLDDESAASNVTIFLQGQGYAVAQDRAGGEFLLRGRRVGPAQAQAPEIACARPRPEAETARTLVLVGSDRVGTGDDELGRRLILNLLATLKELGPALWRLVCVNNGVKLAVAGAEALPALQALEAGGVSILVCGTCLGYFNLLDQKRVGQTTNMLDIVTSLQLADKVVSLT